MAIIKNIKGGDSKKLQPIKKKETDFERISREIDEEEAQEEQDAKDKIKNDKIEKERKMDIIIPYLNNLQEQIESKHNDYFWTFADRTGFKKIYGSTDVIKRMLKDNIKKYNNRPLVEFTLHFHQNENSTSLNRSEDIWFGCKINVFYLDENCNFNNQKKKSKGAHIGWITNDFKITKITLKLLEKIMHLVVNGEFSAPGFTGYPLYFILEKLKKKNIDISEYFSPLANV